MDIASQLEELGRPKVEQFPWMREKRMELVTEATLDRVIDECIASGLYALDLETTGLDGRVFKNKTVDHIVGVCISPDGEVGYYIPMRHSVGVEHNLPPRIVEDALRRLEASDAVAIFHNGKFDHEFLQFPGSGPIGLWDDPKKWEDTLILAYLRNSRARRKGLKFLSKEELKWEMIELVDIISEKDRKRYGLNFSRLDPGWEPTLWYAASDAICTWHLFQILHPQVVESRDDNKSQKLIYHVEKMCVPATRWMERVRIHIDRDRCAELIRLGQREMFDALMEVYENAGQLLKRDVTPGYFRLLRGDEGAHWKFDPDKVEPSFMFQVDEARKEALRKKLDPIELDPNRPGKSRIQAVQKMVRAIQPDENGKRGKVPHDFPVVYDVMSAEQLGTMLWEMGVPGLQFTEKSGQVKTSKDVLDPLIESMGAKFPFMTKIKRFRETQKALSSNLIPIYEDTAPDRAPDECIRVNFNGHKVDTGRFSTPKGRDQGFHGQVRWNLHSIPATYNDPQHPKPDCMWRMREIVTARPGRWLCAIDFSGQELRLATNFSREPLWIAEFFRCSSCEFTFDRGATIPPPPEAPPPFCPRCGSDKIGDLHTLTSINVYGDAAKDPERKKALRNNSKSLNFAMAYGGGGNAAQRAVDCSKEEGARIKRQFDATYMGLQGWWKHQHNFGRKYGYVQTGFARRYPVPDINMPRRDPETGRHNGAFISKAERNSVNGPIQGTGADIMKLAMGLIYMECKKRGWLTKVWMPITIHDELVFEIEENILEEALEVLVEIMTKKSTKTRSWPIPLTVDIELGKDWTVPHNLTEMVHNKKGWATDLKPLFPQATGGEPRVKEEAAEEPEKEPEEEESYAGPPRLEIPKLAKGEVFVYKVHRNRLSVGLVGKLAEVIHKCRNRGTHPLRIETEDGEALWAGEEILINPGEFMIIAQDRGV